MRRFLAEKMRFPFFLVMAIMTAAGAGAAGGPAPDTPADRVDKLFGERYRGASPGIAIVVVRDGKVVLRRGYGLANLEHGIPITPKTVFDIASVSKQFAGMAVSMLIEKGSVSLEDDVRKYIPELPDFGPTITVGHLVQHTSGLRDWPGALALAGWQMDDVISFDQILTFAFNQRELNFEPGSEYMYSNTGYNLLAEMVARISGRTFREFTEANIFEPLGMTDTHFQDDHTEVVPNKAYAYARGRDGTFSAVPNGLTALGSSSLYTSVEDLAKWTANFDAPKVGEGDVLERMLRRDRKPRGRAYAFGLGIGRYRGLPTLSHGGSWASFRTFLVYFPEQRFSVVVLLNSSPSDSNRAAYDVVDIYLADLLSPAPDSARERPDPEAVTVDGSILDEYVGIYRLGPAWYVRIARNGGGLTAYATAERVVPMTAVSETRFWVKAYSAPIIFRRDGQGRVANFRYRGMTCPKLEEVPVPGPGRLAALTGEYESPELGTVYTIALEDGGLVARHRRHGVISLTPAYRDDFRGGTWFLRSLEFDRDDSGRVTGFTVEQGRNRHLRFTKRGK